MSFNPLEELAKLPQSSLFLPGSKGQNIKLLKRVLSVHGIGPAEWRDFNKSISSEYDLGLQTAVTLFQRARGLEDDGIVGPKTLVALLKKKAGSAATLTAADPRLALAPIIQAAHAASGNAAARAVAAAGKALEMHIRETTGPDRGPLVDAIQLFASNSTGYHWCVAFCDVCLRIGFEAAGEKIPLKPGTGCRDLVNRAKAKNLVFEPTGHGLKQFSSSKPQAGDMFVLRGGPTGYFHVGLVVGPTLANGCIPTIEGNSNDNGSANGNGVYARERNPAKGKGVLVRLV